ncbi:MAG: pyruvate formate lyase family protein [Anaerolineae bacterium]
MGTKVAPGSAARQALRDAGEYLACGFFEQPEAITLARMSRVLRRQYEHCALPAWDGEALYPSGPWSWTNQGSSVTFSYSHSLVVHHGRLAACAREDSDPRRQEGYRWLAEQLGGYYQVGQGIDADVSLGGANYTHSILNYGRIVREGLEVYAERIQIGLERAARMGNPESVSFYAALQDALVGIRALHERCVLELEGAVPEPTQRDSHARLCTALRRVPWNPARSFYEGLVALNWMYYLDGCDSLGRFDQDLGALYEADLAHNVLGEDDGEHLVGLLWANVDANSGWNVALGGSRDDGTPAANRLTMACLRAAKGRRRPNLALRLHRDAPDSVLDAALDALATGCGIPALYHDALYLRAIQEARLNVAAADLHNLAFGGCTELMVHGCSNVGSLDGGLNLPRVLAGTLRSHLTSAPSFDALLEAYACDLRHTIARLVEQVNAAQAAHARWQPQPIRTLFIDDCIDAGLEYNAGGARYNWSVINVGGLANAADSLAAVREVCFGQGDVPPERLMAALESDFQGYEELRLRLERCPRYGNDDPRADELARYVADLVFEELMRYAPWRGGRFIASCLMFVTYGMAGEPVMATPDGRRSGKPIADSIGAHAGRDKHGPTALLRSVAGIPQARAPGTLVTNLRVAPSMFEQGARQRLKDLVWAYFSLGGMQVQITVVDQATLRKAMADPEAYGDLIVRIGGYSEYWRNLSEPLRATVLERSEHQS